VGLWSSQVDLWVYRVLESICWFVELSSRFVVCGVLKYICEFMDLSSRFVELLSLWSFNYICGFMVLSSGCVGLWSLSSFFCGVREGVSRFVGLWSCQVDM